jgi:integrase
MSDLIAAYVDHLRAAGQSRLTVGMRVRILRRIDDQLDYGIDAALPGELEAWLARHDWSPQTRASYHDTISGYLRWAHRRGHLSYDASVELVRPRVRRGLPRPATEAQLRHALAVLVDPWRRNVLLSAFAGMRGGEISALDVEHVTALTIWIHGKGGKNRFVKTRPEVWASVQDLPPGPVIRTPRTGRRSTPDYVTGMTARRLDDVGLPELTLHSFRHRFGTRALAAVNNVRVVQELMGHESPVTTAIYTLVTSAERDAAVDALPAV